VVRGFIVFDNTAHSTSYSYNCACADATVIDLYFERCRLLGFQPSVAVDVRLRLRRSEEQLRLTIKLTEQLYAFFTSKEVETELLIMNVGDSTLRHRMWLFHVQLEALYACHPHFALY
jgi:hypothetical protein